MKWIPYGPHALLFQFAERVGDDAFAKGRALAAELERRPPEGLREWVPGFISILLEFDPEDVPEPQLIAPDLAGRLEAASNASLSPTPVFEIPVIYDGADLARVAEKNHLTTKEVAEIHAATVYKVYLLGFTPGFPYLGDLDPRLHTPRLS